MKKYLYCLLCLAALLLGACTEDGKKKGSVKGKAQSAPYELLVVTNKEWIATEAGQSLMNVLKAPIEGLPQMEESFRVTTINESAFTTTFKAYGSIVFAQVGSKYKEPEMRISKDEYCAPQVIIFLSAPDDASFVALVEARAQQIMNLLNQKELDRECSFLNKRYSGAVMRQAQKQFGVSIKAPEDIDDVKTGVDFFWSSASKQEFRTNICMYTLPLRDLSLDDFVAARDSVMKINIPGGRDDQWMETDPRTVINRLIECNGSSVMEVRGLWDMKNDAMGGPFVSYVQVDTLNQRLLVAEGFVFAPEEKKRPIIRQLEASLQTIILPQK